MRVVAALPACALLTGSALGVAVSPGRPFLLGGIMLAASVVGGIVSLSIAPAASGPPGVAIEPPRTYPFRSPLHERFLVAFVALGFGAGGLLLGADAALHAGSSPLRAAFDDLARVERAAAVAEHRAIPLDPSAFAVLEGTLRGDAAEGPSGVTLSIAVESVADRSVSPRPSALAWRRAPGGVVVGIGGVLAQPRLSEWTSGRRVRMPAELHRPSRYLDDGVADGERSLQWKGTDLVGSIKSGALVDLVAAAGPFDEYPARARAFARRTIDDAVGRRSTESAAIVKAIVVGDRAGLSDDVQRALQDAGTYHVIAISGGNIAILAGLMLGAFRVAGLLGRAAMFAAIVSLGAYAVFVGGGASVDRAAWMAILYFAARAADHRVAPLNSLAVVVAAMVAAQPLAVVDPAFVLTVGATLGILLAAPTLSSVAAGPRVLRAAAAMLAASLAAEAALVPIGALFFQRVTFAGVALNFLAVPLMALAQLAGMALVPAALVSDGAARALGLIAHLGALGLVRSAGLVKFAPGLVFRVAPPASLAVVAYYVSLTTVLATWPRRPRAAACAMVASMLAAVWIVAEPWAFAARRGDGKLHVTFIDVGQGDAAFVRFPHGGTLLVDAGGVPGSTFDLGDRVVAPVLRWAGVARLDRIVLSHGDPDHIGGAPSVLREFKPREVWEGIPVPRSTALAELHDEASRLGLDWTTVSAGAQTTIDGVELFVRHPTLPDWERQRVRNDDSVVVELRWGDTSVLLTGDIGRSVERVLAPRIPPARLRVVKVPHHGSLTSSSVDFIRAMAPRVAVISVGRLNHFGHPAPEVLDRYREAGADIFRTDGDGAVSMETDGRSLHVCAFAGRCFDVGAP